MTTTTTHRYVVNRLRINGRATDRVMLTRIGTTDKVTVKEGIEIGIRIENRGEKDARWSFAGQLDSPFPCLDGGWSWRTDDAWRTFGVDTRRYGGPGAGDRA